MNHACKNGTPRDVCHAAELNINFDKTLRQLVVMAEDKGKAATFQQAFAKPTRDTWATLEDLETERKSMLLERHYLICRAFEHERRAKESQKHAGHLSDTAGAAHLQLDSMGPVLDHCRRHHAKHLELPHKNDLDDVMMAHLLGDLNEALIFC